jgi:rubrerythrin
MKNYEEFTKLNELLATTPVDLKYVDKDNGDKEILRLAIIGELDAVSLYEQLSETAKNEKVKKTLLDIAKEEKRHIGELQALLKELDPEYKEELKKGKEEIKKAFSEDDDDEDEEEKDEKEEKEDDTIQK